MAARGTRWHALKLLQVAQFGGHLGVLKWARSGLEVGTDRWLRLSHAMPLLRPAGPAVPQPAARRARACLRGRSSLGRQHRSPVLAGDPGRLPHPPRFGNIIERGLHANSRVGWSAGARDGGATARFPIRVRSRWPTRAVVKPARTVSSTIPGEKMSGEPK